MLRSHDGPDLSARPGLSQDQKKRVLQELETILESSVFRGSRRGQQFLRYIVEQSLEGRFDVLKERSIGIELFGRAPTYDTGDDAVVRVAAKEVRNRLSQYYASLSSEPQVRIELTPGSYIPEFQEAIAAVAEPAPPAPAIRRWYRPPYVGTALALIGLMVVTGVLVRSSVQPSDAVRRFWAPVLGDSHPVLICMASPVVYWLDEGVITRFGKTGRADSSLAVTNIPQDGVVHGRELIPQPDAYVAIGDSIAATRISTILARLGKTTQVRASHDMSFSDLRTSGAVLIGAFTNEWTLEMMRSWPFVFDLPGGYVIRERAAPANVWKAAGLQERNVTEDYALITRVFDKRSGQPLISVAGITHLGTGAAAEYLTDASLLSAALREAPADWERRNLQIVVRVGVIRRTAGSPQFVAIRVW